jgi:hypothetical protein
MWYRARKILLCLMVASLVLAGGFLPPHAVSAAHAHAATADYHHHHDDAAAAKHHHHDQADAEKARPGDLSGQPLQGSPIFNCCVASGVCIALIFASADLSHPAPDADYVVQPAPALKPALLTADNPPPR